jgi:hypothetical protein
MITNSPAADATCSVSAQVAAYVLVSAMPAGVQRVRENHHQPVETAVSPSPQLL